MKILQKLIREPLFQFLVLGALIFFVAGRKHRSDPASVAKIVVTQSQIESMVVGFSRTWMRSPTHAEMRGLVDDYVREEVLYREAKALGLDQDDVIVRRRMRQKFEFLAEEVAAKSGAPSEQDLEAYLQQHPDKYREEPAFTFEHIFFSREKRGASTEVEARTLVARLAASKARVTAAGTFGDALLLPWQFEKISAGETARLFGENFAKHLTMVEPGRWAGPLESSYGLHLVRVDERTFGATPPLANVRESVLRDLLNDRRRQELDAQYDKLRARYTVTVEPPEAQRVAEVR
jgi:hypothetical protein